MDNEIINYVISSEDLAKLESKFYNKNENTNEVPGTAKFQYAVGLVQSKFRADILKGISFLEDLLECQDSKRDYLYYLAIGNARIKEYNLAINYLNDLLTLEPHNRQAIEMHKALTNKINRDKVVGMSILGGAVAVVGGLAAIGIGLASKR